MLSKLADKVILRNIVLYCASAPLFMFVFGYFHWAASILAMGAGGAAAVAVVFSTSSAINAVLSPIGGAISDLVGRKRLIVIGSLILFTGAVLLAFLPSYGWIIILGLIMILISNPLYGGASSALLSESILDKSIRGRIYSLVTTSALVGAFAGSLTLGYLSQVEGVKKALPLAVLVAALVVILRLFLKETMKEKKTTGSLSDRLKGMFKNISRSLTIKEIRPLVIVMMLSGVGQMFNIYLPVYFSKVMSLGTGIIGAVYSLLILDQAVSNLGGGWIVDRCGAKRTYLIAVTVTAVFILMFVLLTHIWIAAVLCIVVTTFFSNLSGSAYFVYVAHNVPEDVRASAYGGLNGTLSLLSITAPLVGAVLWGIAPQAVFIGCVILEALTVPFLLMLRG